MTQQKLDLLISYVFAVSLEVMHTIYLLFQLVIFLIINWFKPFCRTCLTISFHR